MNHREFKQKETIERYVRHELPPNERLAFQQHYFACDECFEQVQMTARFVAGVRDAARSGLLTAEQNERSYSFAGLLEYGLLFRWATPALAVSLLAAVALIGWWAWSLRRENRQLAQQTFNQREVEDNLHRAKERIRELEASDTSSQAQKESLEQEIKQLKEQIAAAERQRGMQLAQNRRAEASLPTINIYPLGDTQRSSGTSQVNELRLPAGTRSFVLLLSDFQSGLSNYRLEIADAGGRVVDRRARLKPDRNGEISVTLNRARLNPGKYTIKLLGSGNLIAEYSVQVE